MSTERSATILIPLKELSVILRELHTWTLREGPGGFVLPQVYLEPEMRALKRGALVGGVERALAAVDELTPDGCGDLDGDASEALALAIIQQVGEFFRSGSWDDIERDQRSWTVARLEYSLALVAQLGMTMASEPDEALRTSVLRELESTTKHLIQAIEEGQGYLAEQEVESDEFDSLPSFDPVPDDCEAPSATDEVSSRQEEPLDIVLARSRSQDRRKKRAEAKRKRADARLSKAIRVAGFLLIPLLTILALLSLWPFLPFGQPPRVDSYADVLPVQGMYRLHDNGELAFIVSPSWNSHSEEHRLADLTELYERAIERESVASIVVLDTQGMELARVEQGVPVLLP